VKFSGRVNVELKQCAANWKPPETKIETSGSVHHTHDVTIEQNWKNLSVVELEQLLNLLQVASSPPAIEAGEVIDVELIEGTVEKD
jgi:hypothetical protein